VLIAGPEISGYNSGDGWSSNWWYTNGNSQYRAQARTHWIDHWIDPLLRFVPSTIDVVTFHTYVPTYEGPVSQTGIVKAKMNQLNQPKPIWITESNRAANESLSPVYDNQTQEGVLADYFCEVYRRMDGTAWQRTFFAMLHDGDIANVYQGSPRGKSLLKARDYEFDEKWLHEAFQAIVDGVYVCTGP
jgi:hypothetical protein